MTLVRVPGALGTHYSYNYKSNPVSSGEGIQRWACDYPFFSPPPFSNLEHNFSPFHSSVHLNTSPPGRFPTASWVSPHHFHSLPFLSQGYLPSNTVKMADDSQVRETVFLKVVCAWEFIEKKHPALRASPTMRPANSAGAHRE